MCGIGGFSLAADSAVTHPARLAKTLAMLLDDRGTDATGFAWFDTELHDRVWYCKNGEEALEFAPQTDLPDTMTTCIAHTRNGTKGTKINNANNHPIVTDGLCLVHNGVIYNDDEIVKDLGTEKEPGEVDSRALAHLLAFGPEVYDQRPEELLERVDGWASIAWLSSDETDVLHLAKLKQSPLYIAFTDKEDLIFGSTEAHVRAACDIQGIELVDGKWIPDGRYLVVDHGEIIFQTDIEVFERPTVTYTSGTYFKDFPKDVAEGTIHKSVTSQVEYIWFDGTWRTLSSYNAARTSQGVATVTAITPTEKIVEYVDEGDDDCEQLTDGKGRVVTARGQAIDALLTLGWTLIDDAPDQLSLPADGVGTREVIDVDHEYGGFWIDDQWHPFECKCNECWWSRMSEEEYDEMVTDIETRQKVLAQICDEIGATE